MTVLKGSVWGSATRPNTYKSPDILFSIILNKRYVRNTFEVVNDPKLPGLSIYHLFSNTDKTITDEWFNNTETKIKFDKKAQTITYIIPEYKTKRATYKNRPVKIYFTEKGWNKLMNITHKN